MLIARLLRPLYSLLYHQLAWAYDQVAGLVSGGRWQEWTRTALPYTHGQVLELGCGPGHLLVTMHEQGLSVLGLDESQPMLRQAVRHLKRRGRPLRLVRARAQALPYTALTFDTVVATFPSEYIFDPATLTEVCRVLRPGGRLVVVGMAWFTGKHLRYRLLEWLFRLTGENEAIERFWARAEPLLTKHSLSPHYQIAEVQATRVLIILAEKTAQ